jgi:hypothetical protein
MAIAVLRVTENPNTARVCKTATLPAPCDNLRHQRRAWRSSSARVCACRATRTVADVRRRFRELEVRPARSDQSRERPAPEDRMALGLGRQCDCQRQPAYAVGVSSGVQVDANHGERRAVHQDLAQSGGSNRRCHRSTALWAFDPETWRRDRPANTGFNARGVAYWTDGTSQRIFSRPGTRGCGRSTPERDGRSRASERRGRSMRSRASDVPCRERNIS